MFDNAFTLPLRELCYISRRELYTLNFVSYFIYLTFTLFTASLFEQDEATGTSTAAEIAAAEIAAAEMAETETKTLPLKTLGDEDR